MRIAPSHLLLPALLVALLALAGCDDTFEPYAETDRVFSVFGTLSPEDERHYVRVEPLQDDRPIAADSTIEAVVTLEELATGDRVVFEDSRLFRQGGTLHNFRGAMDLQLERRYRLTVRRPEGSDGESGPPTTATTTLPHGVPQLSLSESGLDATVDSAGSDRLLFLNVRYHTIVEHRVETPTGATTVTTQERAYEAHYARRAEPVAGGYVATFDWKEDVRATGLSGQVISVTLKGVSAQASLVHPSAPDYDGRSYEELFRPGGAPSNVEHGAGLFVGTTSDEASVTLPLDERPQIAGPAR